MRKEIDLKHFRDKLENELSLLVGELKTVGIINPDNPLDWIAKPSKIDTRSADLNDVADGYEAFEENAGVLKDLENRFGNVKSALKGIDDNSYGYCEVCKKPIEIDRLEANPAAKTCKKHM